MPRSALFLCVVVTGSFVYLTGCKDQVSELELESPQFIEYSIDPLQVSFLPEQGIRDTALVFTITGTISGDPSSQFTGFTVAENNETLLEERLELIPSLDLSTYTFNSQFTLLTTTTLNRSLDWTLFTFNESGEGQRILRSADVSGFATTAPELLFVSNPDTVFIPLTGIQEIRFEAKAFHPIGQNLMDGVFLYLVDRNSNRIPSDGSSFRLFDDGEKNVPAGKDDAVAGDSVYTLILAIDENNSPDLYDVYWYPKDQAGLIGDTLQSQLHIIEP